jgi:hypothetical protein
MSEHNTENPVGFEEAMRELKCSAFYLTALKKQCGVKGRLFMLSTLRDYLKQNPAWKSTDVYPNHVKPGRGFFLKVQPQGRRWLVSMTGCPDVMAEDGNLDKALSTAAAQFQRLHKAA